MATDTPQSDASTKKGYATPGRRGKKTAQTSPARESSSSGNFLTRPFSGILEYFGEVKAELDKVVWPTREQTRRLTIIVTIATIISAMVLGALSLLMGEIIRIGLVTPGIFVALFIVIIAVALAWTTGNLQRILERFTKNKRSA